MKHTCGQYETKHAELSSHHSRRCQLRCLCLPVYTCQSSMSYLELATPRDQSNSDKPPSNIAQQRTSSPNGPLAPRTCAGARLLWQAVGHQLEAEAVAPVKSPELVRLWSLRWPALCWRVCACLLKSDAKREKVGRRAS